MLGRHCCLDFSLVIGSGGGGYSLAVSGLLIVVASLGVLHLCAHRALGSPSFSRCSTWPRGVARGLNCSAACGIFPDQRLNLCLLPWQAFHHWPPGKPTSSSLIIYYVGKEKPWFSDFCGINLPSRTDSQCQVDVAETAE